MLSTYAQSHTPSRGPDFLNRGVGDTHRLPGVRWAPPWGATRGTILCSSLISTHTSHTQSQPGSPRPRALQTLDLPAPHFSQLARKGEGLGSWGRPRKGRPRKPGLQLLPVASLCHQLCNLPLAGPSPSNASRSPPPNPQRKPAAENTYLHTCRWPVADIFTKWVLCVPPPAWV